jgi:hypothetical protein
VNCRYTGVYLDPSSARNAFESDSDGTDREQHQKCSKETLSKIDFCKFEPPSRALSTAVFPIAWNPNSTVEYASQFASSSSSCAFVWNMSFDAPSLLRRCAFIDPAAPSDDRTYMPWMERSWGETVRAFKVQQKEIDCFPCYPILINEIC